MARRPAKENDGKAARRSHTHTQRQFLIVGVLFVLLIIGFVNRGRRERRAHPVGGRLARKTVSMDDKEYLDQVLSASVNLVDITMDPLAMGEGTGDEYSRVKGEFCKINFSAHKSDPTSVPMFRDMVAASPDCDHNRFTMDLKSITEKANEHDRNKREGGKTVPRPMELKGFVFHESRCGSTLVANSLIAMDPSRHRVYSESTPTLKALTSCGENFAKCDIKRAAGLLRDVVYMMGRTNDPMEARLFFKIQSTGSKSIDVFREAFPDTPWVFVYREPIQVITSHFNVKNVAGANCLRTKRKPPDEIKNILHHFEYDTKDVSDEIYCAAHLATICEAAVTELRISKTGRPLNYDELPDALVDTVFPSFFKLAVGDAERRRILEVASKYSKSRGTSVGWKDDSEQKEQKATTQIKKASEVFLLRSYEVLEGLRMNHSDLGPLTA